MDKFLSLTVGGLATGAIYAVAASGLVLTYSTTGTFNFAHGAIGMIAAFLYWQLHFSWGWPTPVALLVVLLVAGPLFGATLERLIFRRLEGTSETTRMVVTISLLLALLGTAVIVWSPDVNRPFRQFFQGNVVELAGVRVPWHQIVSLLVAAAVAVGLRLLLYRTRQGVTMRAAVDNRSLTALTGAEPDRSAMLAWAIGCSLAALSGILVAPTLTLSAVPITLLIINAYGAAVFGRLRSLPLTFLGAILLGLFHDYGIGYLPDLPDQIAPYLRGFVDAIPAVVLFIVVLVLPATRLGSVGRSREIAVKPKWGGSVALAVFVVAGSAMAVPLLTTSDLVSIGKVWALAIIGLSMVPLIGLSGQLSLSQLTFAAFGAIAYAHLGWANPLGLLWAGVIAAVIGVIVALPVVRLQGIYIALATAAFTVLCDRWLFGLPEFSIGSHSFTVFQNGTLQVFRPDFLGLDLTGAEAYFIYTSVIFAGLLLVVVALRRSAFGSRLIAVKEGPAAVATAGINVNALRIAVFALSAAIAGVGGALLSAAEPSSQSSFDLIAGLPLLLMMVLAGISSVAAPVFAGMFLGSTVPTRVIPWLSKWQNALIGFAGVGFGRNPNGFTADMRPISARLKADPPVLVGLVVALVGLWALTIAGVFSNGPYVVLSLAVLVVALVVATRRHARRQLDETTGAGIGEGSLHDLAEAPSGLGGLHVPPELLGLTAPFTDADVAALDDALGLTPLDTRPREASGA